MSAEPDYPGYGLATEAGRVGRRDPLRLRPSPRAFAVLVGGAIALLLMLGIPSIFLFYGVEGGFRWQLYSLFLFDRESNIPTLFSCTLILFNALLVAVVSALAWRRGGPWRWHWAALAAVFYVLAYDEAAQLHERLNGVAEKFVIAEGALSLPWVLFAGIFVAGFEFVYLRFLLSLPRRIAALMLSAGGIYVGGALGVEIIGASYIFEHDAKCTVGYEFIATVEETSR